MLMMLLNNTNMFQKKATRILLGLNNKKIGLVYHVVDKNHVHTYLLNMSQCGLTDNMYIC